MEQNLIDQKIEELMSFLAVFEIEKQDAITIFSQATDKLVDMTDEDYNKTGESMSAFLNMARGN